MKEKIQKIFKYVFIALVIALFALFAFDTFGVTTSANPYTLSVFDLMFGRTIEFDEENILQIKCIPSLLISGILVVVSACSLFVDFRNNNKYRGLAIFFVSTFSLVTISCLMRNFAALPSSTSDYNYLTSEKIYNWQIVVASLITLASLFNLWLDDVKDIDKKIVNYVIIGLLLIPVLTFFVRYLMADYRAETYTFTAREIIFGASWEEEKFSITSTNKDLLSLIHYILVLIAFVSAIVDALITKISSKRVFGYIALFTTLLIGLYYANVLGSALTIKYLNSSEVLTSLNVKFAYNFYGKLMITSIFSAFVLLIISFIKDKDIKEILEFAIPVSLITVFVTLYCQSLSVGIVSTTYSYNIGYQKGFEVLTEKKFSDQPIHSIYLILYYALTLGGFVTSLVSFKNKRIKYLVVCLTLLTSVVFGMLIPFNLYDVVKNNTSYVVHFYPVAWIGFALVCISCLIAFYAAFKFENKKDA